MVTVMSRPTGSMELCLKFDKSQFKVKYDDNSSEMVLRGISRYMKQQLKC